MSRENHAKFLDRLRPHMSEEDLVRTDCAYIQTKYGHRNQSRDSGERYFEHPRAVALIVIDELGIYDPEIIQACLMHDMLEDSYLLDELRMKFFASQTTVDIVVGTSMPPIDKEKFPSKQARLDYYHDQIKNASFRVKLVKLADRLHNCRTLNGCTLEKRRRKTEETILHYLPLIKDIHKEEPDIANIFEREFELAIVNLEL